MGHVADRPDFHGAELRPAEDDGDADDELAVMSAMLHRQRLAVAVVVVAGADPAAASAVTTMSMTRHHAVEFDFSESLVVEMVIVLPLAETADERPRRTVGRLAPARFGVHVSGVGRRGGENGRNDARDGRRSGRRAETRHVEEQEEGDERKSGRQVVRFQERHCFVVVFFNFF